MQNYTIPPSNMELIADISKALNGEYDAIICYEQLANLAPNTEIKNRIMEIRNDEIRHYQTFAQIYTLITGEQPSPQRTEKCPDNFMSGVLAAFKDEQETVDFYQNIARKYNAPFIQNAFTHASADEQNHAVWFLYFLTHH